LTRMQGSVFWAFCRIREVSPADSRIQSERNFPPGRAPQKFPWLIGWLVYCDSSRKNFCPTVVGTVTEIWPALVTAA
jgi:hypothetical protein